jgi:hypothetical protein
VIRKKRLAGRFFYFWPMVFIRRNGARVFIPIVLFVCERAATDWRTRHYFTRILFEPRLYFRKVQKCRVNTASSGGSSGLLAPSEIRVLLSGGLVACWHSRSMGARLYTGTLEDCDDATKSRSAK